MPTSVGLKKKKEKRKKKNGDVLLCVRRTLPHIVRSCAVIGRKEKKSLQFFVVGRKGANGEVREKKTIFGSNFFVQAALLELARHFFYFVPSPLPFGTSPSSGSSLLRGINILRGMIPTRFKPHKQTRNTFVDAFGSNFFLQLTGVK